MRGPLVAGGAAAAVVAIGIGLWLTRPIADGEPVGGSAPPLTTAAVAVSPTATASSAAPSATPSATATTTASNAQTVYIWRDGLPPLLTTVPGGNAQAPVEERIKARVEALNGSVSGLSGTVLRGADPKQFFVKAVKVEGDTATIDYSASFPPAGALWDVALAQQIVFTATEEPTILRVLVTENGKPMNTGHLLWNNALTREDVDGYRPKVEQNLADPGTGNVPAAELRLSTSYSVDTFSPGLARFIVQVDRTSAALPQGFRPKFDIQMHGPSADQSGLRGKALLTVTMPGAPAKVGVENVDRSPLRSINVIPWNDGSMFQLKIDAQYPWRAFVLSDPTRLAVDIGGMVESVSDRIAVYSPASMVHFELVAGTTPPPPLGRQFTVSGLARTFEANVVWRVREGIRTIAEGHATASEGTSAVWGMFSTQVALPASTRGQVTLEVYEASSRDGTPVGLVAVPLVIE